MYNYINIYSYKYSISDVEEKHYLNVLKTCVDAINYPMIEEINKLVKL